MSKIEEWCKLVDKLESIAETDRTLAYREAKYEARLTSYEEKSYAKKEENKLPC